MDNSGLILLIILLDGLGITLVGVGAVLAHTETLAPELALGLCGLGGLAVLTSILAIHWLLMRKLGFLAALAIGAVTFSSLAYGAQQSPLFSRPWINDISTDVEQPPPLSVILPGGQPPARPALPSAFKDVIRRSYPDLGPLRVPLPPPDVLSKAAEVLRRQPGVVDVRVDEARGLVHAVEITALMRFRDDVTVRVVPDGTGSRVDMRSRSRVGKSDLGVNAARIRRVLEAIGQTVR